MRAIAQSAAIKNSAAKPHPTDAAADVNAPRCVWYPAASTMYSRGVAKRGKGGVARVVLLPGNRRRGPLRRALAAQRQRRQAPYPLYDGAQCVREAHSRESWKALAAERAAERSRRAAVPSSGACGGASGCARQACRSAARAW